MKRIHIILGLILAFALTGVSHAALYSATGPGTSTIGSGGDYPSIAAACAAVSGTINNNTVINKQSVTTTRTLVLGAASTFAVGNSITVSIGDPLFDGTFTIATTAGSTITYTATTATVASTATTGSVYTTSGTGTRDATAWTFQILNDLTETINSEIRCTVAVGGSITFKPSTGVRPTITWPNTILANSQSSGHISIGATNGGTPIALTPTNNIIFDGSNTVSGTTRDMYFQTATGDLESGLFIRIRGNNDGIQFKNLIVVQNSAVGSAQGIIWTSHAGSGGNESPDNWVIDNCMIVCNASTSGEAIRSTASGTLVVGNAQSGYSVTNNLLLAGTRGMFLNSNGGGTVSGNTIRMSAGNGFLGWAIYHAVANSATGFTLNITNNNIDMIQTANASAGDFGVNGILVSPGAFASTYNIANNMIGGWAFTGAAVDASYQAISVRGSATGSPLAVVNIEHNSINMNSTASVTGATINRAHAIARTSGTTPPTLNVRNNIIRYLQGGTNAWAIYTASAANVSLSGNNIVVGGSSAGFTSLGGVTTTTFAAYQGLDAAAQNVDPTLTAGGAWTCATANNIADLHFTATPTGLAGTGVATTFTSDFDTEARSGAGADIPGADVPGAGSSTYTWNVAGSGYFNAAANWTPARTTPRFNDILVINAATTPGNVTLNDVRDNHLAGFRVTGSGVTATLSTLGGLNGVRLVVYNGTGTDLQVASGSALRLFGPGSITVDLNGGATGSIDGDVVFHPSIASVVHRILCKTASGLTFNSGSTAAMAPVGSGALGGFGTTLSDAAANSVVFASGSTYYQGGLKDGTRNGGTGSNPFALTAPASVVVFNSGSTYVTLDSVPSISGRTYGNFTWRNSVGQSITGAGTFTVLNDLRFAPSGIVAQGNCAFALTGAVTIGGDLIVEAGGPVFNVTSAPTVATNWSIAGDVDIQDVALFTSPTDVDLTVVLNGSTGQDVDFAGSVLPNLSVNNAAGVTLSGAVSVASTGTLGLVAGEVSTGVNNLTATAVTRTAGHVVGTLRRAIDATVTGARVFDVGTVGVYSPVTLDITSAGTGAGTFAVSATATDHPNLAVPADAINRFWSLTPVGISGFTGTLVFSYLTGDLGAIDENNLRAGRYLGTANDWQDLGGTVDTGLNTVTVAGVTTFSDWTLGLASTLPVELSGFSIE